MESGQRLRAQVRLDEGATSISTGVSVLDHLLELLAAHAGVRLGLEVAPGGADDEVAAAGYALGEAFRERLRGEGIRGFGSGVVPASEALALVALEASSEPLLVSNVDLSQEHVGGLRTDLVSQFLRQLAEGAGLTLHVRLIVGSDPNHVLAAIFKSLGVALADAAAVPDPA